MQFEITKEEYRDLLDLLYVSDWVLHAHKTQDEPGTKNYRKLEQKILAFAEEMGFGHLIMYEPKHDRYYPTRTFEDVSAAERFIDEYDDNTFWEELVARLAERDLIEQEGGLSKFMRLSLEERLEKQWELEKGYAAEFEEHGLENIRIDWGAEQRGTKLQ